jgi:hypothetical protein
MKDVVPGRERVTASLDRGKPAQPDAHQARFDSPPYHIYRFTDDPGLRKIHENCPIMVDQNQKTYTNPCDILKADISRFCPLKY